MKSKQLVANFAASAGRVVQAGVDVVELHAAHGDLPHQFLSPMTNSRNDEHSGSFENRIRLPLETFKAISAAIFQSIPPFLGLAQPTGWRTQNLRLELGWDLKSTVRITHLLPDIGVDLLDVTSDGNVRETSFTVFNDGNQQAEIAATIKAAVKASGKNLLISTVGEVTDAKQARDLLDQTLERPTADVMFVGRQVLKQPGWVLQAGIPRFEISHSD